MNLAVVFAVLPIVLVGELPDKTMFASLVLASRGRPAWVWLGTATAFAVHVVIAVSIGVALVHLLPHRAVEAVVAVVFAAGAIWAWLSRDAPEEDVVGAPAPAGWRVAVAAGSVVFLAEWGDLTQILTANLAARYDDPLSVGIGAVAGLWLAAGLAVIGGANVLRVVSVRTLRVLTAVALTGLAVYSAVQAVTG